MHATMKNLPRWGVLGFIMIALLALIAGPADSRGVGAQDATPVAVATPGAGVATVRVVHASPDAPAVDVFVDGARAVTNLPFGEATDFVALPAGSHDFQVVPTGAEATAAVIDVQGAALAEGSAYEVAAVGLAANIQAQVYEVDLAPLAAGKARVRIVHASPDAPAVDVAVTGGPILFENAVFPGGTDYAEVDATAYDLEVRPTGTTDVALALPGTTLEAGMVYDIFAIGQVGDATLSVLVLTAPAMGTGMATPATS